MTENKTLPLLEIIVLTLVRSNLPIENIPTIKVLRQGSTYVIVEGGELIENALAEGFGNLNTEFQNSILLAVDLDEGGRQI